MFRSKTLFVVGAGASKEAGLPIGSGLKSTIAERIDIRFDDFGRTQISGDPRITGALHQHVKGEDGQRGDINPFIEAGWRIRDAMPQATSIDNFIDIHYGDEKIELCGKLAIVQSILEAERNSLLFLEEGDPYAKLDFGGLEKTWYTSLFRLLTDGCRKENVGRLFEQVSFISFNYDRCIEHFLFYALQNVYGIEKARAEDIVQTLDIFHPYGVVGELAWQAPNDATAFGINQSATKLLSLAGRIKTFTERVEEEKELAEMRQRVREAHTIVFIGFAFHEQNMELIKPENPTDATRVFATGLGISDSDSEVVRGQMLHLLGKVSKNVRIELRNKLTCYELFGEYQRSLAGP